MGWRLTPMNLGSTGFPGSAVISDSLRSWDFANDEHYRHRARHERQAAAQAASMTHRSSIALAGDFALHENQVCVGHPQVRRHHKARNGEEPDFIAC
jgi:hypothetical protein